MNWNQLEALESLEFIENQWQSLEIIGIVGNVENAFTGLRRETVCRKKWGILDAIRRKCSGGKTVCRKKWEILDSIRRKCYGASPYSQLLSGAQICFKTVFVFPIPGRAQPAPGSAEPGRARPGKMVRPELGRPQTSSDFYLYLPPPPWREDVLPPQNTFGRGFTGIWPGVIKGSL